MGVGCRGWGFDMSAQPNGVVNANATRFKGSNGNANVLQGRHSSLQISSLKKFVKKSSLKRSGFEPHRVTVNRSIFLTPQHIKIA